MKALLYAMHNHTYPLLSTINFQHDKKVDTHIANVFETGKVNEKCTQKIIVILCCTERKREGERESEGWGKRMKKERLSENAFIQGVLVRHCQNASSEAKNYHIFGELKSH